PTAFDDDVGVRLEQADQLLAGRHRLAIEHPALGLDDDARDQRQIMVDLGTPAGDGGLGALGHGCGDRLQLSPAGLGSSDQVAIELTLLVLPAAVAIADQLQAKLTSHEKQVIAAKPTNNVEAYDAYLRGLAYASKTDNTAAN